MTTLSRSFLLATTTLLFITLFVPIWRIELSAPQYPEGLVMQIHADKLAGQVDIINGLNHYIGMATLHTENFIEFKILPYIISFFIILMLFSAIIGKRIWLYISFVLLALFGILSMIDFYRWGYNYGHNLDPHAAIIVPGMAYQPPLIGYKELLNFGAYSVPDIGGWLFVVAGMLLLIALVVELGWLNKFRKTSVVAITAFLFVLLALSCKSSNEAEPIKIHTDMCAYCKMIVADGRFGAEIITEKGRIYKFDDISCMLDFKEKILKVPPKLFFIHQYLANGHLIDATTAFYVAHENVKSPMAGNIAAFSTLLEAEEYATANQTEVNSWEDIIKDR